MSLLDRKVRGFRLVDLVAAGLLIVLILGVYLAKTMAGRERAEIASAERQIADEKARIRLLQAEVAHLEEPARLEHLSQAYLGLAPVSIKHDVTPEGLNDALRAQTAPEPVGAPP
jgi:cell division protein FtsL